MASLTRRDVLTGALAAVGGAGLIGAAAKKRPNVILILADDMGFSDIGCYGSEIPTPNIDGLAKTGLRFTQFYNNARCCPTRASLLTGLYPHQAGVGHMVNDRGIPPYQGFLNDRCVTLGEAMRDAGYTTMMSGKWHVGENRPHWPVDRGFEHYFGLIGGSSSYFRITPETQLVDQDTPQHPKDDSFYMTDLFTEHTLKMLDEHGKGAKPFFLYQAFTSPHWPLHARPEEIAKYRGKYKMGWDELRKARHARMIRMGIVDANWPLTVRDPDNPAWETLSESEKDRYDLAMAVYAAQIDRMDQCVGRILAKLKEIGQDSNTLILFLSDNGGCAEKIDRGTAGAPAGVADSFLSYGQPWANASNTPFRLYKHWVHEGGIATPLIAHWPGKVKHQGKLSHQPGHLIDIMATCLDVAGSAYPSSFGGKAITASEGMSLAPLIQGKARADHSAIYWEHEGNRAVRQGKWKLVARFRQPWELYDLAADRTETTDLASSHAEKVKELADLHAAWAKRCGVVPFESLKPMPGRQAAAD